MPSLTIRGLPGLPEVVEGDDVGVLVAKALRANESGLTDGDVVVVSSKIVSKAAGLRASGARAEVVAGQTVRVVAERSAGDHVTRVVESVAGPVMVAAGVDASNVGGAEGELLLLPADADGAARALRDTLLASAGRSQEAAIAVVVSDTAGRPWRSGQVDFALGSAGLRPVLDHRGEADHDGRLLAVTARCIADELAAAADLVKGKSDHVPVAIVSGCPTGWFAPDAPGARTVVRTGPGDWFALGHVEAVRAALGVAPGSENSVRVGIPGVGGPDPFSRRVTRAVALALDTDEVAADLELDGEARATVSLSGPELAVGRALGRLEVAASCEHLTATRDDRQPALIHLRPGP